jgi:hypothetical protein
MSSFYMADVRKRANAELSMPSQAIPEERVFVESGEDERAATLTKNYRDMMARFGQDGLEDPVPCDMAGCEGITMEWTTGASAGQIDFYGVAGGEEEPQCFLALYVLSGKSAEEDKRAMKPLEQYADFGQCTAFPLVLQVIDDSQSATWKHEALGKMRPGMTALAAAFLKVHFSGAK